MRRSGPTRSTLSTRMARAAVRVRAPAAGSRPGAPSPPITSGARYHTRRSASPASQKLACSRGPPSTSSSSTPRSPSALARKARSTPASPVAAVASGQTSTSAPAAAQAWSAAGRAAAVVATRVGAPPSNSCPPAAPLGPGRLLGAAAVTVRPVASTRTRNGCRPLQPGRRTVSRGSSARAVQEEGGVLRLGGARAHPDLDLDAGGAQLREALAADVGVGVLDGRHHPGDAGGDQRAGARRGAPVVSAGLQADVAGGTGGAAGGPPQRQRLGVGLAGGAVEALADDLAVAHQHGANHGIGAGAAEPERGQVERSPHPGLGLDWVLRCHHGPSGRPRGAVAC